MTSNIVFDRRCCGRCVLPGYPESDSEVPQHTLGMTRPLCTTVARLRGDLVPNFRHHAPRNKESQNQHDFID